MVSALWTTIHHSPPAFHVNSTIEYESFGGVDNCKINNLECFTVLMLLV